MIEKNTTRKILGMIFDFPSRQFHLRELSRLTGVSLPSVISVTDKLAKEGIITKVKGTALTTVAANRESDAFLWHKRLYNLENIYTSGIVGFLSSHHHHPQAIILFGSFSRGEDTEKSDIDLAIIGREEKSVSLRKFQTILKKKISLHCVMPDKASNEFKANLANGIVLEGSW